MLIDVLCTYILIQMSKISKDELFESVTVTEVVDLNGEIGRGSYGVVKKVSLHGTVCAAKVVHEILLTGGVEDKNKPVQDFILECYKCSTLRHPNLVQFLGLYYPDKTVTIPWLIMEMLDTSLRYLLEKHDKPSDIHLARKMSILQDVSLGIQYLHAQKIIHRDLSSNNILLTKHLVAKVADLGVAKLISPHQLKTLTETPGTLVFMPPEVQEHSPHYGMPVDVFSFGCVTVHLMSHQWPAPEGRGVSEIEKRWKYVREVQIMPPLIALISDCLENEPNKRPIISEVVQKLESIVSENSLVVSDVVEIEKELASGNGNEVTSVGREVCHCMHTQLKARFWYVVYIRHIMRHLLFCYVVQVYILYIQYLICLKSACVCMCVVDVCCVCTPLYVLCVYTLVRVVCVCVVSVGMCGVCRYVCVVCVYVLCVHVIHATFTIDIIYWHGPSNKMPDKES